MESILYNKTEEQIKQRARELLQMPKEDLLTNYMLQEQEIERLNNIINETIKDIEHSTLLLEEGQVKLKDTPFGKRTLNKLKQLKGDDKNESN